MAKRIVITHDFSLSPTPKQPFGIVTEYVKVGHAESPNSPGSTFVLKYEQLKGSSVLPIYTDFLDNLCNF